MSVNQLYCKSAYQHHGTC